MARFPNPPRGWDPTHPHGCWMDDFTKGKPISINFKSFPTFEEAQKWVNAQDKDGEIQFDRVYGDWTVTLTPE